ncbi:MAG: hypothetical protein OXQ89_07170 [Rhodospirillaceae bacterium]|nr:hypothetical protein [Rhodospirillaceae bacterium]
MTKDLEKLLDVSKPARLIPTISQTRKEERLVSVLLGTLRVVRPLAEVLLGRCGVKLGKTAKVASYVEVKLPDAAGGTSDRPDGVICVSKRNTRWAALLEAKIDNVAIDEAQVRRYAESAKRLGVDAVITLSNQLVPLPTHTPYTVPKRLSNKVRFFHLSWVSILTHAALILRDRQSLDVEQAFVLDEMVNYFEHPGAGVKRFDRMNPEWRPLVLGVRVEQQFKRNSDEISNTVSSWHQEERDLCLILDRRIGQPIGIRMPRKHQMEPAMRLRDASDVLVASKELRSSFIVPNAAGDIDVTVNLQRRTVTCSMTVKAPGDRKRPSASINWLVRQLKKIDSEDVLIRTNSAGRSGQTQAPLSDVLENPKCLEQGIKGPLPSRFEVAMVRDLAGRFSGRRTFIDDVEAAVPEYYDRVGQHVRAWTPPPPPIEKRDPIGSGVDGSPKVATGSNLAQAGAE